MGGIVGFQNSDIFNAHVMGTIGGAALSPSAVSRENTLPER
ncbi:MAG: hypothetical protein ACLTFJ_10835 [Clostridium sp.]